MRRWLLYPAVSFLALGCSSETNDEPSVKCGPGTVLAGELCVPDVGDAQDASLTDSADTATAGEDSSVPDDADSGAEPYADASLDSSPADSMGPLPDSGGGDTDTPDDTLASSDVPWTEASLIDATGDVFLDAATGGDPCPATGLAVDCSGACAKIGDCATVSCFTPVYTTEAPRFKLTDVTKLPMVIRTPDKPGIDPLCQPRCGAGNTVYGIAFRFNFPYIKKDGVRVRVGAPWKIYRYNGYYSHCIKTSPLGSGSCYFQSFESTFADLLVATTDPTAQVRNIYIEQVAPGGTRCEGL